MSVIKLPYASTGDLIHSSPHQDDSSSSTYTSSTSAHPTQPHHRQDSFDDVIYQEFYQALEEHRQQQDPAVPVTKSNMAAAALQESRPMMFETSGSADVSLTAPASPPAPPLPQKNARRSRILDGIMLKLDSHREATTPHDVYLSSEEDASSSADDFSDYDWESSSEVDASERAEVCEGKLAGSPTSSSASSSPAVAQPRRSHEITARAVAVVFAGKPAIIELSSCSRRSTSPSEPTNTPAHPAAQPPAAESTHTVAPSVPSAGESESPFSRYGTSLPIRKGSLASHNSSTSNLSMGRRMSASSATSSMLTRSTTDYTIGRRQSSNPMLTSTLTKQAAQPTFLSIDPYANGSAYSLNSSPARKSTMSVSTPLSATDESGDVSPTSKPAGLSVPGANTAIPPKTPKTPTAMFKEFSRSVSNTLNRKRSRQSLGSISASTSYRDSSVFSSSPMHLEPIDDDAVSEYGPPPAELALPASEPRPRTAVSMSIQKTPERRDSLRSTPSPSPTPTSEKKAAAPGTANRWSTLSVRRRSMKIANKII